MFAAKHEAWVGSLEPHDGRREAIPHICHGAPLSSS